MGKSIGQMVLGGFFAVLLSFVSGQANAVVIGFDDIAVADEGGVEVEDGYQGLNWDNFWVRDPTYEVSLNGFVNGVVSPANVGYNQLDSETYEPLPASFASTVPFTFTSAYFTAAWTDGMTISVVGLLGDAIKETMEFTVDHTAPLQVFFNWSGIDTVAFTSFGGNPVGLDGESSQFVIDDIDVSAGGVSSVPLPAALPLFGFAVVGLGGAAARARRKEA